MVAGRSAVPPLGRGRPVDQDPAARSRGPVVTQRYRIGTGALADSPWLPFMFRPSRISDIGVGVDPISGMVVPTSHLRAGAEFTVQSRTPQRTFDQLPAKVLPGTSAPPATC